MGRFGIATSTAASPQAETAGQTYLTPDEIGVVIGGFGHPERMRLLRMSAFFARDHRISAEDLRQEAFVRALGGQRKCQAGSDVVAFLIGVMRSMVSAEREADAAGMRPVLIGQFGEDGLDPALDVPSPEHQALSTIFDRRTLDTIGAAIGHDAKLVALADALCDGLRGVELEQRLGVSTSELATMRKRLGRTVQSALIRRTKS